MQNGTSNSRYFCKTVTIFSILAGFKLNSIRMYWVNIRQDVYCLEWIESVSSDARTCSLL